MELTVINEYRSEDDGRKDKEDTRITFGESKNGNSEMKEEKALVKVPPKSDIKIGSNKLSPGSTKSCIVKEKESKPVAVLELVNLSDTDSESETEATPKSISDLDYNDALNNHIQTKEQLNKINEDKLISAKTVASLKRPSSPDDHNENKKLKLELENTKTEIEDEKSRNDSIKKHLEQLTREQLEDMVTEKIAELISTRSEIGHLRRKLDLYKQENENWKNKQQSLQKMCMDLKKVVRQVIVKKEKQSKEDIVPQKIKRSVGLQVSLGQQKLTTDAVTTSNVASSDTNAVKRASRPITTGKSASVESDDKTKNKVPAAIAKIQQLPKITLTNALRSNVVKSTASKRGALIEIDANKVIDVVNLSDDEVQSPKPIASTSSVPTTEHQPTDERGVQKALQTYTFNNGESNSIFTVTPISQNDPLIATYKLIPVPLENSPRQ